MPAHASRRPAPRLALAALLPCLAALPDEAGAVGRALAGPARPEPAQRVAPAAARPAQDASAPAASEDARACSRSRRKLWQDGEGWAVKAVTVCR